MRCIARRRPAPSLLCPACLRPRRSFASPASSSSSSFSERTQLPSPPQPPPAAGFAPLASRGLLSVSGPDAAKFLQGIVTANVARPDGLPRADAFYTGFLTATGRVIYDAFIYPFQARHHASLAAVQDEAGFLIEADAAHISDLAKYVKRYKLRAKVNVAVLPPDQARVWQAWDDADSAPRPVVSDTQMVVRDTRALALGHRIVRFGNAPPEGLELERSTEDAYTIRRYLQGVPEGHAEVIREQALPLEANMDVMGGIDFRKGCYVGQELTIRTKHRGVVRKRILPCMLYDAAEEPAPTALAYHVPQVTQGSDRGETAAAAATATVTAQVIPPETSIGRVGKRGRSAGKWLRGVGNVGLGLCRLETMTDVALPDEQGAASYAAGDEFVLALGEDAEARSVKVKAFVPDWLRASLGASGGG